MMLHPRRQPPSRQSKPSILTAAGFRPIFVRAQLPELRGDIGEAAAAPPDNTGKGEGSGPTDRFSPNRASCTTGFPARLGGEPQKNGGDIDKDSPPLKKRKRKIKMSKKHSVSRFSSRKTFLLTETQNYYFFRTCDHQNYTFGRK